MNIAIYGRKFGKSFNGAAIQLFEALIDGGAKLYFNEPFYNFLSSHIIYAPKHEMLYRDELPSNIDFDIALCIGGDGTFLETATYMYKREIPILGINSGRMGFLSTVGHKMLLSATKQILENNFTVEDRILLEITSPENLFGTHNFALNDFTIQKHSTLNMIKIRVDCNGEYLNTYWSDGLIVSTPTGSTAYSLSCNGPILIPNTDCFVITPIANHNLTVRPVVVPASSIITLHVEGAEQQILTSLDYKTQTIKNNNQIRIKKSNFKIKVVILQQNNYFSTLREKLMWGVDIRN
jgi:NAD+ kinase